MLEPSPLSAAFSVRDPSACLGLARLLLHDGGADPNMPHVHHVDEEIVSPIELAMETGFLQARRADSAEHPRRPSYGKADRERAASSSQHRKGRSYPVSFRWIRPQLPLRCQPFACGLD